MMLKTGNERASSGFTLIEVMVTAAVLALGTVFIFESNLMNMNVYGRYVNRLAIQNWADQKIWQAKEALLADDFATAGKTSGDMEGKVKTYHWELETSENASNVIGTNSLYEIKLNISWPENGQAVQVTRNSFVLKIKR